MIWLLAYWRPIALAALIAIPAAYAAVQKMRLEHVRAEFAQYRARIASEAAEAEVRAAQEAVRQEKNTREVLDDLQTRYDAISARYARLRQSAPVAGGSPMPANTGPAHPACPSPPKHPDTITGCLPESDRIRFVLEMGDRELAKYRELWDLDTKNAAQ